MKSSTHKQKIKIMKKIIAMAFAAISFTACNDSSTDQTTVNTNDNR